MRKSLLNFYAQYVARVIWQFVGKRNSVLQLIQNIVAIWDNFWALIGNNQAQLQVCILLAAFVYAIVQTSGLRKQIKLSLITTLGSHLKEVNEDLLQYGEVARGFGMTTEGSFASILIGIFALWHDSFVNSRLVELTHQRTLRFDKRRTRLAEKPVVRRALPMHGADLWVTGA